MRDHRYTRRSALTAGLVVVVGATLVTAGPTHAAPTSVSVASGVLGVAVPTVNDFAVITLNGAAQSVEAALEPFSVTDARGNGQGWTLNLRATAFQEWDGTAYVAGGKTLPEGSLSLPGLSVVGDGTDSGAPEVMAGPHILDAGAVAAAVAGAGVGMGRFTFSPAGGLRVAVPASAYARTYRSDLSLSVTSGP